MKSIDQQISLCAIYSMVFNIWILFQMKETAGLESKGQPKFTCVRWNPHHNCTQVATANDSCIRGWDLRTMQ